MGRKKVYLTDVCSIDGCDRKRHCAGLCTMHYFRKVRHGDPLGGKPYELGDQPKWIEASINHHGEECLTWPFKTDVVGYPGVLKFRGKRMAGHRAMCIAAHGEPPTKAHQAAHSCGRGHMGCVNPKHLRWATALENAEDRRKHGTTQAGERHSRAKLAEADIAEIRASTLSQVELSRIYGVHFTTINKIVLGKTWASAA